MAEQHVKNTKYKYDLNSSLVQQQRHNAQTVESGLGDGTGTTLVGQKLNNFGDRVSHSKPEELQQKALKKLQKQKIQPNLVQKFNNHDDVLHVQISQDDLIYRPRTRETKAVYEQMLAIIGKLMGDQPLDTIKGALDEVISILKQDLKETERKAEIEALVDKVPEAEFNSLSVLAQCLVDYQPVENLQTINEEVQVDPEMNFSESEESNFEDVYQVKDLENQDEAEKSEQSEQEFLQQLPKDVGILSLNQIDAQWLSRNITEQFDDTKTADMQQKLELQVLEILGNEGLNLRDCEKKLLSCLGHKKFTFVRLLLKQRYQVYFGVILAQAQTKSERDEIMQKIKNSEIGKSFQQPQKQIESNWQATDAQIQKNTPWLNQSIDLDKLSFQEAGRLMTNKKCNLPRNSVKIQKKGYDEIQVPAIRHIPKPDEKLIPISSLPQWTHAAFPKDMITLNTIQSKLFEAAFKTPENLLVCAPTGAGKTNIALLTILQVLDSRRRGNNNTIDTRSFKIVYIAPMKALVSEVVGNFSKRLEDYGIKVRELTGDTHLSRQQIEETQIIVTTPEKWDIITRKSGERAYVDLVKLIIIDEVHLLHDQRGPVLEAIIARTIRQIEQTSELVRIVALSATLPNYQDVAMFLRVKKQNLFYFDNSYRPVPLEQVYIGLNEKKAIKRLILMNEILYEKIIERAGKHQILVFTHSRKETIRTAKVIRDLALQQDQLSKFLKEDSSAKELLLTQVDLCDSQDLKDILPFGIGIHHAGMTKRDRKMVEDLFAGGYLQLLCSTATLAWGVNLPAHTVILKGTQIYSPEKGKWIELSPQDVLQMMGRAGRPQYDTVGEGIIITNQTEMQYYLSLNNMQLPIESQMISQLADQMSAEVVLGTISNVKEAVNWLSYTYLYVRMLRNPKLYGIDSVTQDDPTLIGRRQELVYSAAMLLQKSHMVKFDIATGSLQSTALGKIAAYYYIKCESMQIYSENMKPHMNSIDLFRLFSLSKEFQYIPIRENEKIELVKFIERVPIPVKGSIDEPSTKINILLQAYISRFKMDGYDINSDTVYVSQNSGRIMRALFEIAMKKGWASLSEQLLNLCKICEKRLWNSMTPLRQFIGMPNLDEIAKKIEKKAQFQWQHFYEMSAQQLGDIVGIPKFGRTIQQYINKFPRIELEAYVQPLTRTILRIQLDLKVNKNFSWDLKYHGTSEPFWILIHDSDNETILHTEQFMLKEQTCHDDHSLSFTVKLHEPMPPQYFVKVISDRWMHSETSLPISFKNLILPDKFPAPIAIQDMYPKRIQDLKFADIEKMYAKDGFKEFNTIQTQVFDKVYQTRESVFIGAPSGSDSQIIVELAIFKELQDENSGKVLYLAPKDLICQSIFINWSKRFQDLGLKVALIDNNQPYTLQAVQIDEADVVISTPKVWETISRRWRQRKVIHQISLVIFDYMQLMSPEYEVVVSRTRLIQNELKQSSRIIGLSCPIANGKDVAQWIGVSLDNYFNFSPNIRPIPIEASILSYDQFNRTNRLLSMAKPAYNTIKKHIQDLGKAVVFVSDRKQTRLTALDFVTLSANEENPKQFLTSLIDDETLNKFSEKTLKSCLDFGIGFIHDGMTDREIFFIRNLFKTNQIRLIIVSQQFCWDVADLECHLVVTMDTERYCGFERRYIEYDIPSVLQMQSLAKIQINDLAPKFLLMVYQAHKDYFVKFMQEPLPLESQLADNLHDFLNTEIVAGTITTKQEAVDWLTWTFLFRRLAPNPNYYNLTGRSPQNINDFISQLIEDTIEDLVNSKCILVDEETELDLMPANLGRIAAFYGVQYQTIGLFAKHLDDEAFLQHKLKSLLQILSQATEFASLPIRDGEEALLHSIAQHLTYAPSSNIELNTASQKTLILLQNHFDRKPLPIDLSLDQKFILKEVIRLVHAMVDVIRENGFLNSTLQCMEMSQMCVQAMWSRQSPLLQLPYITTSLVDKLKDNQVRDINDFMNMDDDLRENTIQISEDQMQRLAAVCNRYPQIQISFALSQQQYQQNEEIILKVTLNRTDEDEEGLAVFDQPVFAQYFPVKRYEEWWVVAGHVKSGKLLSIKKVAGFRAVQSIQTQLQFNCPSEIVENNQVSLRLYLICDSYVGADLQEDFIVKISY